MKDFSIDIIKNAVEKSFIKEEYHENIVYQWLKRPCLLFKKKQNILSQESLFYICFQLLDYLKQYEYLDNPQLQTEIQCIPYEIEHLLDKSKYPSQDWEYYCTVDRLLIMTTLYTLLRLLGIQEADVLARYLVVDINYKMPGNFVTRQNKVYSTLQNGIQAALTNDSPIYKHSTEMMHIPDCYSEICEMHLIEFVQTYFASDRLISEEIAAHLAKDTPIEDALILPAHDYQAETEQLQKQIVELQTTLQKKDEEIATLKEAAQEKDKEILALREEQQVSSLPTDAYIEIESKCKSKVTALLTAMYYAHYFHGVNLPDKDQAVAHILKYGFHYSTKSAPQLVSSFVRTGGDLETIKEELHSSIKLQLEDAMKDLTDIQKVRSSENAKRW